MSERYATQLPGSSEDQDPSIFEFTEEDLPLAMKMLQGYGVDFSNPNGASAIAGAVSPELLEVERQQAETYRKRET